MHNRVIQLVERIFTLPGCTVKLPSSGQRPHEWEKQLGMQAPADLLEFLKRCDGVELFVNNHYTLYIHGISQIERANPLIVGEPGEKDRSYDWFVIANDGNGAYLSIDLAPQRLGKCYDSAFACHAVAGSCAIVATSFTDLLERAVQNRGQYWWWLGEDFPSMGDAYDA